MYIHPKDVGSEYLVDVMIEKNIIGIDSEKAKERVPETVVFFNNNSTRLSRSTTKNINKKQFLFSISYGR